MTDKELEKKIAKAFSDATPDVFDKIVKDIEAKKTKPEKKVKKSKRPVLFRGLAVALAAAAAIVVTVGVTSFNAVNTVASVISLDVNPSIEINVNKDRRVLSVVPKSEDAKDVIGTMNFKNTDLEVTVNALLGSMISKGYISEIANSILVSVDNADRETAADLQDMLMNEINEMISSDTFKGAVIGQVITDDEEIDRMASQYGITISKSQLIKELTEQNPTLKFEDLVSLTINELNLLKKGDTDTLSSIGTASDEAYIGAQRAVDIALEDAGFHKEDTSFLKVEMDYENGDLCYEISFHKLEENFDYDYDYDINAVTGEITGVERELENISELSVPDEGRAFISEEEAKNAALSAAGVNADELFDYEFETDMDRFPHFDIEFKVPGLEYNFAINAYDGTIIKNKWEKEDKLVSDKVDPSDVASDVIKNYIGDERAKQIALEHAGVNEAVIYDLEIELERDRGSIIYEVEFKSGIYDYSYDIDPISGKIIDYEMDFER